jgi:hypothetical protein
MFLTYQDLPIYTIQNDNLRRRQDGQCDSPQALKTYQATEILLCIRCQQNFRFTGLFLAKSTPKDIPLDLRDVVLYSPLPEEFRSQTTPVSTTLFGLLLQERMV